MAERLKVGVIGVGTLGAVHARVYHEMRDVDLTVVYDAESERNREIGAKYSLPICRDLDEALSRCDALSIVTPTDSHCATAMKAMGKGKHVFIEKPVASSVAEAEKLKKSASARGIVVGVGHIERFNPAYVAVKDELGTPRFIEAHRLNRFSPRGLETAVVLELMIHDIDLILSIVNSPITEIRAVAVPVVSDTDDIANCRLEFANGCVANLTASRISAHPLRKMRIFTDDRYAGIDLKEKTAELYRLFSRGKPDEKLPPKYTSLIDRGNKRIARLGVNVDNGEMLVAELDDFVTAVTKRGKPRVGLDAATKALSAALDIVRVAEQHREKSIAHTDAVPSPG